PEKVIGVYRWNDSLQAGMLAEISHEEALEPFVDARNTSLLLMGLAALLAVGIGLYASGRIAGPITALAGVATRIASGALGERSPITRRNETGVLAGAFNNMADQVQELVGSLEQRVEARTEDLFLTLEVSQLATRMYQSEELLPRITETIRERFGLYYAQVYLLDDAQRYAVLEAGTGDVGQQLLEAGHRLDLGSTSIVTRTVQTRSPVLVADTRASDIHMPNPLLPQTRSEVAIPLIIGDEVLGVLDMQAAEAGTFNPENVPVFEALASQLATALFNARQFAATQQAIDRADQINRRLTRQQWESYLGRARKGQAIGYAYDLQTVEPITTPMHEDDGSNGHLIRQEVSLAGEPIGVIAINEDSERQWSRDEYALIEGVAERLALAVEQFRAFDQTQAALGITERQAERLVTLNEMAREMSAAADLEEVYKIVAARTSQVTASDRTSLGLVLPNGKTVELYSLDGVEGALPMGTRIPVDGTMMGHVISLRDLINVGDIRTLDFPETRQLAEHGLRSSVSVPLIVGDEVHGVLNIGSRHLNAYDEQDEVLMRQIASLLSAQLQSYELFDQVQTRAAELETVSEIAAQTSTILDVDELLWTVANLTRERFDLYHAHIYLLDETQDVLRLAAGSGIAGREMARAGHRIVAGSPTSLVARAARNNESVIVNNVNRAPDFLPNPLLPNTRSELAVPMVVGGRVIGVLDVQADEVNRFTETDAAVQTTLAAQIAAAVNNARTFAEVEQLQGETSMLYDASQRISTATEINELIAAVVEAVHVPAINRAVLFGFEYGSDGEVEVVTAIGNWHSGEGSPPTPVGRRYDLDQFSAMRLALTDEPLFFDNVQRDERMDPNIIEVLVRQNILSIAVLPLWSGRRQVGSLFLETEELHRFTDEEVRPFITLASQMAVGLDTLQLLEQTERRAAELATVAEVSAEASTTLDPDKLLWDVANLTKE
ncbi:MAG: GAF domain-containing protein, partial [Chloroflexi bacterium]|nr:GAF domain-containing protein [Chloroflexota bacterium]